MLSLLKYLLSGFSTLSGLFFFLLVFPPLQTAAQWNDNLYGNEWISYNKKYLRIQIDRTGIQRVAKERLPQEWRNTDPENWQLWHRGQEKTIIESNESGITFYGETNNGASDSIVHRPANARLNPYQSLFSNQGVYFLTIADSPKRAVSVDASGGGGAPQLYHLRKDTVLYNSQFAHTTRNVGNSLNQSYYDQSNSWTGPTIGGPNAWSSGELPRELKLTHSLKKIARGSELPKPKVEMLFAGIYDGFHDIKVESLDEGGLYSKVAETSFNGWSGKKCDFEVNSNYLNSNSEISFRIHSVSQSTTDWFSLSYYTITYPQRVDMGGERIYQFDLPSVPSDELQLITIENVPADAVIYDISDRGNIAILNGKREENSVKISLRRKAHFTLNLLVQSPETVSQLPDENIAIANFTPVFTYSKGTDPSGTLPLDAEAYDYIMICNDILINSAIQYAQYRTSEMGGNHRVILTRIRDVYDQFNYGEPSPVAIRSFMRYMLRHGIRESEHNLLLLGPSITYPNFVVKELPNEVPTLGDPGSDNLLVAGINNTNIDLQAIPVGRIKAYNDTELLGYLEKVKVYEHESSDISWRKNVLHLTGGHSSSEISTLKSALEALKPIMNESDFGGSTTQFVKTVPTVEKINISKEINEGAGLISYFGHGSQTITDLDFGYATDVSRGYSNRGRYPLMYFNGCGVGNIFSSRSAHILSDDWLLAKEKGAIAVIANTYLSYISPSSKHIRHVYKSLFESDEIKTIGKVLYDANKEILSQSPSSYDITNIHQAVLQGDPVLKLVRVELPDYLINPEGGLKIQSKVPPLTIGGSDTLQLAVELKNGGRVINGSELTIEINFEYRNGSVKTSLYKRSGLSGKDTLWVKFPKDEQISRIYVRLDPDNELDEFTKSNNLAEILFDWESLRDRTDYLPEKDMIPPTVTTTFDGVMARNQATIAASQKIRIQVRDDRSLVSTDTNSIQVFIKPCWDDACSYDQIPYGSSLEIEGTTDNERSISLALSLPANEFPPGNYTILVFAKDRSGNSPNEPYTIPFSIGESLQHSISVYPNPASNFVKFTIDGFSSTDISSFSFAIYSALGTIVEKRESLDLNSTEWYWIPSVVSNSGIYLYDISIKDKSSNLYNYSGKLLIQK